MLVQGLLQPDPYKRIDWLELCLHPFWDGELTHLADTIDGDCSSQSMISDSSKFTPSSTKSITETVPDDECIETIEQYSAIMDDSLMNGNSLKIDRPETVPQRNTSRALNTSSLDVLEERPSVASVASLKPPAPAENAKEAWQGTYKLERGLVLMDLSDVNENGTDHSDGEERSNYSKTRESKSPVCNHKTGNNISNGTTTAMPSEKGGGLAELLLDFEALNLNVIDHLYHSSDLQVNPIAENPKLVKLLTLKWDTNLIGFHALNMEKLRKSSKEEIKTHIATAFNTYSQVRKSSQDKIGTRQKMHILAYLSTICKHEEVSNIILSQNHMKHLISEFKVSVQLDLKIRLG